MTRTGLLLAVVVASLAACAAPVAQKATALLVGTKASAPTVVTALDARQKTVTLLDKKVAFSVVPVKQAVGGVTVWASADNTQFAFRDEMLISSRGAGADLMSSSGPTLRQIKSSKGPFARTYHFLDGADQPVVLSFVCTVQELPVPKGNRHIAEDCTGAAGGFRNEYLMSAGGKLSETIQWLGPSYGRLLVK